MRQVLAQVDLAGTRYEFHDPGDWSAVQLNPANDFLFTALVAVALVAAALWFTGLNARRR